MMVMKKFVPAPFWSVTLFALWILLARSTSPGTMLLGVGLAYVVPALTVKLRSMPGGRVKQPVVIARYCLTVCRDVVLSNVAVAWGVLFSRSERHQSRFVIIPIDLRDPVALAALAMVTTVVPGTVWSELALDRSALLLHVWDVGDEQAFIARYKARYEQPLREIFE